MRFSVVLFLGLLCALAITPLAHALRIHDIENDHALIDLEGQIAPAEGALVVAKARDGRALGVLRVQKVIGEKALGRLIRGQMELGWKLEPHNPLAAAPSQPVAQAAPNPAPVAPPQPPAAAAPTEPEKADVAETAPVDEMEETVADAGQQESADEPLDDASGSNTAQIDLPEEPRKPEPLRFGALGAYTISQQRVSLGKPAVETSMTGAAFSGHGFVDWNFWDNASLRPMAGVEQFFVTGQNTNGDCNGNTSCATGVVYASGGAWLRYLILRDQIMPWIGVGSHFLYPLQRVSNAIQIGTIGGVMVGTIGGGVDIKFNERLMVPIQVEYAYWPQFANVNTSWISVRAGVAF